LHSQNFERVREVIAGELGLQLSEIELDSNIVELGADSLHKISLMQELEEEFKLEISDEDMQKIFTVGDIVKFIENAAG